MLVLHSRPPAGERPEERAMSDIQAIRAGCTPSGSHIFSGCGYPAPSIDNFFFMPIFSIGYFKNMAVPSGAPWWILPLLSPIELLSNIIVRPFTLSIRLFANMLAGHLLLLVFYAATWYLFSLSVGLLFSATSFVVALIVTLLEVLITALQAFIFTTLTAFYFAYAIQPSH